MTDVKDNSWPPEAIIDDMLLELWGAKTYPIFDARANAIKAKLKTAILEEMDRVIADLIGDDEQIKPWLGDAGGIRNIHRANLRDRWQEVRERL